MRTRTFAQQLVVHQQLVALRARLATVTDPFEVAIINQHIRRVRNFA